MENEENVFVAFKDDISAYIELKLKFYKLIAIEKTAKVVAILSHSIFLLLIIFFAVLFMFLALGFFLGDILDNMSLGFLIVGGIYLLLTLCAFLLKNRIQMKVANAVIKAMQTKDDDDDDEV